MKMKSRGYLMPPGIDELAESTSSMHVPQSRRWSLQRRLSGKVGELVLPAKSGPSTLPLRSSTPHGKRNVGAPLL
ncbi:hypothetical protein [Paraburkholderia sp. HP33-1]|uniref:hypothetical protein n=1 Tax=Paraburkholderia sp. HP33-1 TaxID=2883243 RepID=UPI001F3F022D|nr:hypothetical protein [Paraburkholderia sp. HP33-1]